ncbi:MAG: hypothetical protein OXB88_03220, partial [Bacteriovoracales bacterium]|nr:hypothetical protein [Bacteriovoracales bacterium]
KGKVTVLHPDKIGRRQRGATEACFLHVAGKRRGSRLPRLPGGEQLPKIISSSIHISLILISINCNAADKMKKPKKLRPLISKQTPGKMRYVGLDGKISFYQKRNGSLALATNFKVSQIMKGPIGTYYFVVSGTEKNKFLLLKNESFLTSHSINNVFDLYTFNLKKSSTKYLGKGLAPRMHLFDTWATYYNPHHKKIYIKSLVNSILDFTLDLNSANDPFFIPEILIIDNDRVLFTDVNKKGHAHIFLFTRSHKKITPFYYPSQAGKKIELCMIDNHLYVGEFSLGGIGGGSQITEIKLNDSLDYSKGRIIYESKLADFGNLICYSKPKRLYFIKVSRSGGKYYESFSDVVELNPKTTKVKYISNEKNVTQVIEMDRRILIPHNGDFLIAKGEQLEDDSLN